jgi:hypothetical protein
MPTNIEVATEQVRLEIQKVMKEPQRRENAQKVRDALKELPAQAAQLSKDLRNSAGR